MAGLDRVRLLAMLTLQASMNAKVNSEWLTAGYPWMRAVIVEGAEAMEHYGWKWWKKQTPDMDQLRIELVDIWHFALSNTLVEFEGDPELAQSHIRMMLGDPADLSHGFRHFRFEQMDLTQKLELMISLAGINKFSFKLFESIMFSASMDWETLHVGYVSKNVLNFFRQDHGYKSGTYIKDWDGKEDNVVLHEIVQTLDTSAVDFEVQLYNTLRERYMRLLNSGAVLPQPV